MRQVDYLNISLLEETIHCELQIDTIADNTAVTVITESRNLRALQFRITEDQLTTVKVWEDWLVNESIKERLGITKSQIEKML